VTVTDVIGGDARPALVERLERAIELTAQELRREFLNLIRPFELSLTQVSVLFVLRERNEATRISELSEATLTPASSMTHAIERLVQRGLIERRDDANDRRASLVSLTPDGIDVVTQIQHPHRQHFMERCESLEESELALLVKLFERFTL